MSKLAEAFKEADEKLNWPVSKLREATLGLIELTLDEAETDKAKVRRYLNELDSLLTDREVPEKVQEELADLKQELDKNWQELADASSSDKEKTEESEELEQVGGILKEAGQVLRRSESKQSEMELLKAELRDKYSDIGEEYERPRLQELFNENVLVFSFQDSYYRANYSVNEEEQTAEINGVEEVEIAFVPAGEDTEMEESALAKEETELKLGDEFIQISEAAIRDDGTTQIKVIEPGWGSSGYYSKEVLERDGPQIFNEGTEMYWNHPTAQEERQRPEGNLDNLAGKLDSDAYYMEAGPEGPGLYADAYIYEHYQPYVEEMAPDIGLSIRASGKAHMGEAEGQQGKIVDEITQKKSVDFVTKAGAGGKVVNLFESAVPRENQTEEGNENMDLKEAKQEIDDLKETKQELSQENARLKEKLVMQEAKDFVADKLAETKLPKITKNRLVESLAQDPPVTNDNELDKDEFEEQIEEAAKEELEYISNLTESGKVKDMGGGYNDENLEESEEELEEELNESLQRLGLEETR